MKKNIVKSVLFLCLVTVFTLTFGMLHNSWSAEKYPSRPVELVCGLAPGGAADLMNRTLAKYFEKNLGATFISMNKPGPSQMMAASYVAKSKPDGYTIGQMANQIITAELTGLASGYTMDELRPICQVSSIGLTIVVPTDSKWKTFQDFLDDARENPGIKYAHHGVGSGPNTRMELLNKFAKLGLIGMPLKGEGEIIPALLGKHIPIAPMSPVSAKKLVASGQLRILFTWQEPALDGLDPDTPSFQTVFGDEFPDIDTMIFLWAPRETPEEIVKLLEETMEKMTKDPEFIEDFKKTNFPVKFVPGDKVEKEILPAKMKTYRMALDALGKLKK